MKKNVHTLQDTLGLQLQALYYAEKKLKDEYGECSREISSENLKKTMHHYELSGDEKMHKLERIFNYLMLEPEPRKNKALIKLLEETRELLSYTDSPHLKDILMVSCLQNINALKISGLKVAYMFTLELEMDTASDLLQQLLELELETSKALAFAALEEFNKETAVEA